MPTRIIREADNIKLHSTGNHIVEPEYCLVILSPKGNMHHYRQGRVYSFHAFNPRFKQVSQLVGMADVTIWPEYPVVDLIPDLDHCRQCTLLFQGKEHLCGICFQGILQRFKIRICPCMRFILLLRIGPVVAVMKIQQQFHSGIPDPPGHYKGLPEPAISLARRISLLIFRVDKDP